MGHFRFLHSSRFSLPSNLNTFFCVAAGRGGKGREGYRRKERGGNLVGSFLIFFFHYVFSLLCKPNTVFLSLCVAIERGGKERVQWGGGRKGVEESWYGPFRSLHSLRFPSECIMAVWRRFVTSIPMAATQLPVCLFQPPPPLLFAYDCHGRSN